MPLRTVKYLDPTSSIRSYVKPRSANIAAAPVSPTRGTLHYTPEHMGSIQHIRTLKSLPDVEE